MNSDPLHLYYYYITNDVHDDTFRHTNDVTSHLLVRAWVYWSSTSA